MLIREIVTERDFGIKTGIRAVKSLFKSKPSTAAKAPDDAAQRAAQDARAMSIAGKGFNTVPRAGERVKLNTMNAAKDSRTAKYVKSNMRLSNYYDGQVVEIIPSTRPGFSATMKVKLDKTGEIVTWPVDQFVSKASF